MFRCSLPIVYWDNSHAMLKTDQSWQICHALSSALILSSHCLYRAVDDLLWHIHDTAAQPTY